MEKFFKHPRWIVAVIAALTIFFALQIPRAQLDNNNFRFVPEKDPERLTMKRIDDTFGSQIVILVGLERRHGTIFDADFLNKVRSFSAAVGKIGIVESATSIVSTDYITGAGDSIIVEPLVAESFTGTSEEIALLKDRLTSWDLYSRALVSDDFSSTQILVNLDIPPEDAGKPEVVAVHKSIKRLAEQAGFADTNIYITGMPVFSSVVNDATRNDLIFLVPLVVLVVVLVLLFSFRRLSGIVLPLLTVLISAIWAVGAMPLFGVKLSIISTVLPVILVAVGSAYGIHVVSHYFDEMAGKSNLSEAEHRALVFAVPAKDWPARASRRPDDLRRLRLLLLHQSYSNFRIRRLLQLRRSCGIHRGGHPHPRPHPDTGPREESAPVQDFGNGTRSGRPLERRHRRWIGAHRRQKASDPFPGMRHRFRLACSAFRGW